MRRAALKSQLLNSVALAAVLSLVPTALLSSLLMNSTTSPENRWYCFLIPQLVMVVGIVLFTRFKASKAFAQLQEVQKELTTPRHLLTQSEYPEEIAILVTALRDAQEGLDGATRVQQRLLTNAATQLCTPLATIKAHVHNGLRMSDITQVKEVLLEIDAKTERLTRVLNQLIVLNRVDTVNSKMVPLDMNFVVSDMTAELIELALERDIELRQELSHTPAMVTGEWQSLRELVRNILENALVNTSSSGSVVVRIRADNDVVLTISDTGRGLTKEEMEHVFECFYRVPNSNGTGCGLGLSIVQRIAASHGASLSIESGVSHLGTSVMVRFPKAKTEPFVEAPRRAERHR